jgi:hypothetical protein
MLAVRSADLGLKRCLHHRDPGGQAHRLPRNCCGKSANAATSVALVKQTKGTDLMAVASGVGVGFVVHPKTAPSGGHLEKVPLPQIRGTPRQPLLCSSMV